MWAVGILRRGRHRPHQEIAVSPDASCYVNKMPPRWVVLTAGILALALGIASVWMTRNYVGPDGLSYLEIASHFLDQGPRGLVNGYWSPMYPVFIAVGLKATGRDLLLEYLSVHIGNWLGYALSVVAFWFFLASLRRDASGRMIQTSWPWLLMALAFFLDGDFNDNAPLLEIASPDILITAVAYWIAALLLRIADEADRRKWWLWLGVALAAGYHTKSMYFAMAPLVMLIALIAGFRRGGGWVKSAAASAIVWAALCAPWVTVQSAREGRLSFGETGRLAYVWFVNHVRTPGCEGVKLYPLSKLKNPPAVLMKEPVVVFDFTSGPAGTIPSWFDQSYYGAGVPSVIDFPEMWRIAKAQFDYYWKLLFVPFALLPAALLVVVLANKSSSAELRKLNWRRLALLAFPVIPFLMYAVVVTQYRYLPAYWVIFWLLLWDAVDRLWAGRRPKLAATACLVIALFLGWRIAGHMKPRILSLRDFPRALRSIEQAPYARAGFSLNSLGAPPGSPVVALGDNFWHLYARPARVRVSGQIDPPDVDKFWKLDEQAKGKVYRTLADAGFRAIVTVHKPPAEAPDWRLLDGAAYWARILP